MKERSFRKHRKAIRDWIVACIYSITMCCVVHAQDNTGIIADNRIDKITGAAPVGIDKHFNQSDAVEALRDVVIAPDNARAYGITFDGMLYAFDIDRSAEAPALAPVFGTPIDLSGENQRPVFIRVTPDSRTAYIGGQDIVFSVNLVDEYERSGSLVFKHQPFTQIEHYPLEDFGWSARGREIAAMEISPDGERLIVLIYGKKHPLQDPQPEDHGLVTELDISADVKSGFARKPKFIEPIPLNSKVYDLRDMAISPDGNYALIISHGSQQSKATPFGALPGLDEGSAGVTIIDLNTMVELGNLPTSIRGQNTFAMRREIFDIGLRIKHPKVTLWEVIGAADQGKVLASNLLDTTFSGGISQVIKLEALNNKLILEQYKETFFYFGIMRAYSQMYPTSMVGGTSVDISPHGDLGIVTFMDTNNLGFLDLRSSPDLGGYGPGNIPTFFFAAATEKVVSGLNLDLGIEGGDINFMPPYSWLALREVEFTSDGSHAFVGMDGGVPTNKPHTNRFGFINIERIRQGIAGKGGTLVQEALSAGFMRLFGLNEAVPTSPEFGRPKSVATFSGFDSDGDSISDHIEAFNRFNDLKPILFGDRTQVVSTNSLNISDPTQSIRQDVYPVNYGDKAYFLPHSGVGYRFNFNGHLKYSVNVGSPPAVRTIERIAKTWHQLFLDDQVNHPYFVVTDMSHPGSGLVQNEKGEYRHFNPRTGFQANFHYFKKNTDETIDFVLSNTPSQPLNNETEGPIGLFDSSDAKKLFELFLADEMVEKIILDPKVVDIIGPPLKDNDRVEIHGSTDPEFPNTRRDMDSFFKVIFSNEGGIGISADGASDLAKDFTGSDRINLISLNPDNTGDDAVGIKIDVSLKNAHFVEISSGHEMFFDKELTMKVPTGKIRVTDIKGSLWLKIGAPGNVNVAVKAFDVDENLLTTTNYDATAFELNLDVGTGRVTPIEDDADGDEVPDFADGYNLDNFSGTGDVDNNTIPDINDDEVSSTFHPITIKLSGPLDFSKEPVLRVEYDVSYPDHVNRWVSHIHPVHGPIAFRRFPHFALPGAGTIRLWGKKGSEPRTLLDFLPPGSHKLSDLGMTSSSSSLTLYVEAVVPIILGKITVSLDPDGFNGPATFIARDSENVFSPGTKFDLQIDSNNDDSIGTDDDAIEDIENDSAHPGKILLINNSGSNGSGRADYTVFRAGKHQFAELKYTLPPKFDPETARISISYSASNPKGIISTGLTGLDLLPAGHLRIWKSGAGASRNPETDFIAPGTYPLSELPSSGTLYVEAVGISSDVGDQRIVFQFDPGVIEPDDPLLLGNPSDPVVVEEVNPFGLYEDAVRVTVYEQRWESTFASDSDHRKLDINGLPFPDTEPQNEPETDNPKRGFYIDAYSRTPVYSHADISIPTLGPRLAIEFRRTSSIDAFLSAGTSARPVHPVGNDNVLGAGWRTNLGMRVVHANGIYTVYDDNGQAHRYNAGGQPIPHSFQEASSHRSELKIFPNEDNPDIINAVIWTRNFWTQYQFGAYNPNQADFGDRPIVGQILRLTAITDNNGNSIECKYDGAGDSYPASMKETGFDEKIVKFDYITVSGYGKRLEKVTDPKGNTYEYKFDGEGNLKEVWFPNPNTNPGTPANGTTKETYVYEKSFTQSYDDGTAVNFIALKDIVNPNGNKVSLEYEKVDRQITMYEDHVKALHLKKVTTAKGSSIEKSATLTQPASGPYATKTEITAFNGASVKYEFTTALLPSSLENGLGYAFNGFVIPVLDKFDQKIVIDGMGEQLWSSFFSNDTFCNLEQVTDSYGNVRLFTYGMQKGFDHSRYNRPYERIIDPATASSPGGLDLKSRFEYDFITRKVLKEIKPRFFKDASSVSDPFSRSSGYDNNRNLTSTNANVSDANGNTNKQSASFKYDALGYISVTVDPDGRTTSVKREKKSNGWKDTTIIYKEFADKVAEKLNLGSLTPFVTTVTHFDLNGNLIKEEVKYDDPDGGGVKTDTTDYTVDAANNTVKVEFPAVADADSDDALKRPTVLREYDGMGKIKKETDARVAVTSNFFDERENASRTITDYAVGKQITVLSEHNAAGLITKKTDANGNITNYEYDELNRLVKQEQKNKYTDPEGAAIDETLTSYWEYKDNAGSISFSSDSWEATAEVNARGFPMERVKDAAYRVTEEKDYFNPSSGEPIVLSENPANDRGRMYEFDDNNNVTKLTLKNPAGSGDQITHMKYDELDRVIEKRVEIEGPDIITKTFYDNSNNIVKTIDGEGVVMLTEYNTLGLPSKKLLKKNGDLAFTGMGFNKFIIQNSAVQEDDIFTRFEYDGRGNRIKEILKRHDYDTGASKDFVTDVRFDALSRIIKSIENSDQSDTNLVSERIKRFSYDLSSNLRFEYTLREDYELGGFVEIKFEHQYDLLNRKLKTIYPLVRDGESDGDFTRGEEVCTYDDNGNKLTQKDPRGMILEYKFDGLNRVVWEVHNADGAIGAVGKDDIRQKFKYDKGNNILEVSLRRSTGSGSFIELVSKTTYDSYDRPIETTDAEGNIHKLKYDNVGNIKERTDPRGFVTMFEYDDNNRRTKKIQPQVEYIKTGTDNDIVNAKPTSEYEYDRRNLLVKETDPNGHVSEYKYDFAHRRIELKNAKGDIAFTTYDQAGNVRSDKNFRGFTTTYAYDGLNRRIRTTDAKNFTLRQGYDQMDNLNSVIDPKGKEIKYEYDRLNRKIAQRKRGNVDKIIYQYTLNGSLSSVVDENGISVEFEYDLFNRQTKKTDGDNFVEELEYDQASNTTKKIDQLKNEISYVYDKINRLTEVHEELSKITKYEYDKSNNRNKIVDANNYETEFKYDALNRLTEHVFPTGKSYKYKYDATINCAEIITPNLERISHIYDSLDRLDFKTIPGHTYDYEYDKNSNQTSVIHTVLGTGLGGGQVWSTVSTYTSRDMLETVTSNYPGVSPRVITYTYDENKVKDSMNSQNGRTISYKTNDRDQYNEIKGSFGSGTLISNYKFDEGQRLESVTYGSNVKCDFKYNKRDLPIEMAAVHQGLAIHILTNEYDYDGVGNRKYEKEIYQHTTTSDLDISADIYRYDDLYRVTGVKYDAEALRTTNISENNLPNDPGDFLNAVGTNISVELLAFDKLHNRTERARGNKTTTYNNVGAGYVMDPLNRIHSHSNLTFDPDDDDTEVIFGGAGSGITLEQGDPGISGTGNVFFIDANKNEAFDNGEDIFGEFGGSLGVFDINFDYLLGYFNSDEDVPVFDGNLNDNNLLDGVNILEGSVGTNLGLFYFDNDVNHFFNIGIDDYWTDVEGGIDGEYDPNIDQLFAFFSEDFDLKIYGGELPRNTANPLNSFTVSFGAIGAQATLYYHDRNLNGIYDPGEDIWFSNAGPNYDAGPDGIVGNADDVSILIFEGDDGIQVTNGTAGAQESLYYNDSNNNQSWDEQESIWSNVFHGDGMAAQNGLYYYDANENSQWDPGESFWKNQEFDQVAGKRGGLAFFDENSNGVWDIQEPIWINHDGLPPDPGGDPTANGFFTLDYDDNGNILREGLREFTWNALNQMERVKDNTILVARYIYDDKGRRCAKLFPNGERVLYYYDDWEVLLETNGSNVPTAEYLTGRNMDEPVAVKLGIHQYYFHQNAIGNIEAITDFFGNVVERYDYDIYGNVTVLDGNGIEIGGIGDAISPYLFTGRRYDEESGLYYFRSRYYSSTLGRFISTDPLDYVDGMNLYAYVNGNVVNLVDPMGENLFSRSVGAAYSVGRFAVRAGRFAMGVPGRMLRGGANLFSRGARAIFGRGAPKPMSMAEVRTFFARGEGIRKWASSLVPLLKQPIALAKEIRHGLRPTVAGSITRKINRLKEIGTRAYNSVAAPVRVFRKHGIRGGFQYMKKVKQAKIAREMKNAHRIEVSVLMQQGLTKSQALAKIKEFNKGNAAGAVFHFTNTKFGNMIAKSGQLFPTKNGLRGPGAYTGTTPTPNFFQRYFSPIGWGVNPGSNVRIPILMNKELAKVTRTTLIPHWTKIVGKGQIISFRKGTQLLQGSAQRGIGKLAKQAMGLTAVGAGGAYYYTQGGF